MDAHGMICQCAAGTSVATLLCNHTFGPAGITAYLKNGTLESAAAMAAHPSTRTHGVISSGLTPAISKPMVWMICGRRRR
jgi:hypothetical protein